MPNIIALIDSSIANKKSKYHLVELNVKCGNLTKAQVDLKIKIDNRQVVANFSSKDGPVDAIFSAIRQAIPHKATLELYQVSAVTGGIDAQANVAVRLKVGNKKILW